MGNDNTLESQPSKTESHGSSVSNDVSKGDSYFRETADKRNGGSQWQPKVLQRLDSANTQTASAILQRIGWSALVALIATLLLIIAVMGFLSFIFWGDTSSNDWHKIMVDGWATRSISIPSLILRAAVDIQAGIVAAMLAALALESGSVLLQDAARVSTARVARSKPRSLLLPLVNGLSWRSRYWRKVLIVATVAILTLTTLALQFSSTILLSDLRIGMLPGSPESSTNAVDFSYGTRGYLHSLPGGWSMYHRTFYKTNLMPRLPTWTRTPTSFPRFAEYAEQAGFHDGVDDTGILLRVFLPYSKAEAREMVRNYTGDALVLDSRVSCQRPVLRNLIFETPSGPLRDLSSDSGANYVQTSRIIGTFAASVNASRLTTPGPLPFNCSFLIANDTRSICTLAKPKLKNATALYISNRAGGLVSEFSNQTDLNVLQRLYANPNVMITWGTAFLVFNVSSHHWRPVPTDLAPADFHEGFSNYSARGNHSIYVEDSSLQAHVLTHHGPANLSMSLCYAAFDTQRIPVNAFGESNSSEPTLQGHDYNGLRLHAVNRQLDNVPVDGLSTLPPSPSSRGILNLQKKHSWIPPPENVRPYLLAPFVQAYCAMDPTAAPYGPFGMPGNLSTTWSFSNWPWARQEIQKVMMYKQASEEPVIATDGVMYSIFESALQASGSLARAMSSLITVLSSQTYYDQLPMFDVQANISQTFFTTAVYPQSHRGFWSFTVILIVHVLIVALTTTAFAVYSQHTFLDNYWQSVAQLYCNETEHIFKNGTTATDKELRGKLRAADTDNVPVVVAQSDQNEQVSLIRSGAAGVAPRRNRSTASTVSRWLSERGGEFEIDRARTM